MTPAEIAELRRIVDAATPADKWKAETTWNNGGMPLADFTLPGSINGATVEMLAADAHFAVAARTALPALLDEVERLTMERDEAAEEQNAARQDIEWMRKSRDDWKTTAAHTATERRSEEMTAIHAAHAAETDRDRLRALLREAVEIARDERWTSRPPEVRMAQLARLAALASEGGVA